MAWLTVFLVAIAARSTLVTGCSSGAPKANASACAAGLTRCGTDCLDLQQDELHCGSCETACVAGQRCAAGSCVCQPGLFACGASCVETASSSTNCGACDQACPGEQVCSLGRCAAECGAGLTLCGRDCVNTDSSIAHCGRCGHGCGPEQTCSNGQCACGARQTSCGSACVELETNREHCGACSVTCAANESCQGGHCLATDAAGGSGGTSNSGGTSGGGANGGGAGGASGSGSGCEEAPLGAGLTHAPPTAVTGQGVVTSSANTGPGSLRDVIAKAAPGATITFDLPGDAPTLVVSGQIDITQPVVLDGSSEPGLVLSAAKAGRMFGVEAGQSLTLRYLQFKDGYIPSDYGGIVHTWDNATVKVEHCVFEGNVSNGGGAIFVRNYGTLEVDDTLFVDNDASKSTEEVAGGAIGTLQKCNVTLRHCEFRNNQGINGGGIYTIFSNLTVEDSIFIGNDSTPGKALGSPDSSIGGYTRGYGGGIYIDGASRPHDKRFYVNWNVDGDAQGGLIAIRRTLVKGNKAAGNGGGAFLFGYAQDKVVVVDSMFVDNQVILDNASAANGGGVCFGPTQATVQRSTFARNQAGHGGGVYWSGPGNDPAAPNDPCSFRAENSTFAANKAEQGGGIWTGAWYPPVSTVESCTFVANSAAQGGAVFENNWGLTLHNTLLDRNQAPSVSPEAGGSNNLEYPRGATKLGSDTVAIDPGLGALGPNGGLTWTFALAVGSSALDAGSSSNAPSTDQRGEARRSQPDIGAFERQASEAARACP